MHVNDLKISASFCRKLKLQADEARTDHKYPAGGYVTIYSGKVCGWSADLTEAWKFRPGVFAVDALGFVYQSTGGNFRLGAEKFDIIFDRQTVKPGAEHIVIIP